eukprot:915-Heterococcus_DN1.PRE.2
MSVMLESAVQARAATEQQPIAASGSLATAFKAVHTRITGVLSHPRCPHKLLQLYTKASGYAAGLATVPERGAAAPTAPKCTIM